MNSDVLKNMLSRRPFEPMRVKLTTGETFEIRHPEMAMLTRSTLAIVVPDADGSPSDQVEYCSYLHIAGIGTTAMADQVEQ